MARGKQGRQLTGYVPDHVIFDLETTGLSPLEDQIIEISAVRVEKGKVSGTFSTLVDPGRPIPKAASKVNGITDEMVAGAPKIKAALEQFLAFIGTSVLVGHNIHTFDMKFLRQALFQGAGKELPNDYIDTLPMARRCLPQLRHHRLTDLASYFHISTEGAHRALNDCVMTQKCYEEMGKLMERDGVDTGAGAGAGAAVLPMGRRSSASSGTDVGRCPRCGGELIQRKGRYGAFLGCGNFPSCRYTRNL